MKRAALAITCVALLGGLLPAFSSGAVAPRQAASATFTETRPGRSTGLELRIDYVDPNNPSAKPPAVRTVVTALARGASYDTSVPALCGASNLELMLLGVSACPAASAVGGGIVTVDTGVPGPGRIVTAEVDFLNNTDQLIFLNTVRGTPARTVIRADVAGGMTSVSTGFLPGTPPGGGAIDTVAVDQLETSNDRGNYITTPPRCPARGFWVNRVSFTYFDGVTQTVAGQSPCESGA